LAGFDTTTLALIFAIFVFAGFVKGAVAIGLPTIAVALLAQFLDTREAIALMLYPLFVSNLLLAIRGGHYWRTFMRYRHFIIPQMIILVGVAYLSRDASGEQLKLIIGVFIILFAVTGLVKAFPRIPEHWQTPAKLGFGSIAGVLAGIISIWAPPIVIYLQSSRVDKEEFARASGIIITLGAIPLLLSRYWLGHLNLENTSGSLLVLIPSVIGFYIGEYVRKRISEEVFRKALLIVFLLLGINMLI